MFDDVRDDILEATNNRQQPYEYGSLTGKRDFSSSWRGSDRPEAASPDGPNASVWLDGRRGLGPNRRLASTR
jgi:hypothetical protein